MNEDRNCHPFVRLFNPKELNMLLSGGHEDGSGSVDIDDLRRYEDVGCRLMKVRRGGDSFSIFVVTPGMCDTAVVTTRRVARSSCFGRSWQR